MAHVVAVAHDVLSFKKIDGGSIHFVVAKSPLSMIYAMFPMFVG